MGIIKFNSLDDKERFTKEQIDKLNSPHPESEGRIKRKQYKNKKFKSEQGVDRQIRISNCQRCKGDPSGVSFQLGNIKGIRCEECLEVIKYEIS